MSYELDESQVIAVGILLCLALGGIAVGSLIAYLLQRGRPSGEADRDGSDMVIPEAAVLLHGVSAGNSRAVAAVLLDLAARGHVTLESMRRGRGILKRAELRFQLDRAPSDALSEFESDLLAKLQRSHTSKAFRREVRRDRSPLKRVRELLIRRGFIVARHQRSNTLAVAGLACLALTAIIAVVWRWDAIPEMGIPAGVGAGLLTIAPLTRYTLTSAGAAARAKALARVRHLHQQLEEAQESPSREALVFLEHLPWVSLSRRIDIIWVDRLIKALKTSEDASASPAREQNSLIEQLETANAVYETLFPPPGPAG